MPKVDLSTLDCTSPGRGPWKWGMDIRSRAAIVRNTNTNHIHKVYYGTRTGRTQDDAEAQAIALCAVLNAVKAKRP